MKKSTDSERLIIARDSPEACDLMSCVISLITGYLASSGPCAAAHGRSVAILVESLVETPSRCNSSINESSDAAPALVVVPPRAEAARSSREPQTPPRHRKWEERAAPQARPRRRHYFSHY